jgi:hypothetical protein
MNDFMQDLQIISHDHTESFNRVWDRLSDHMAQAQKPSLKARFRAHERMLAMSQIPVLDEPKPQRQSKLKFTLIAAVILAILVTGCSLAGLRPCG